jgi:lysophospholipase L1-like esterase
MTEPADDSRSRDRGDVPDPPPGRRGTARDALVVIGVAVLLLVLFQGAAVRNGAEELSPGVGRDVVAAVGEPTGWIADNLPLAGPTDDALAWLESDGGPATPAARGGDTTLLVTGDSLSMPLDTELARRYAGSAIRVERDPHVGTGISKSGLVDWRKLSAQQVRKRDPQAVVVFIGANEGFPLPRLAQGRPDAAAERGAGAATGGGGAAGEAAGCCGADWQAAFAARVRAMMGAYRQDGDARVYWLTVPKPRDPARQEIAAAVNAAVVAAAGSYGHEVRVIDLDARFAPDGDYTDAIDVDGRERIVREQDGIHLNAAGAAVAADIVQDAVGSDFARPGG